MKTSAAATTLAHGDELAEAFERIAEGTTPQHVENRVIRFVRGDALIRECDGSGIVAYTVDGGDLAGRGLLWVEVPGHEPRIIPTTRYRETCAALGGAPV